MLTLRPEQVQAVAEHRWVDFEARMHAHVCRCFPVTTRRMSDQGIREVIRQGETRALAYGIDSERGVCKYVNLMFVFGRDFDRDPRLPWAREILDGARVHRSLSTIDLLYQEALLHQTQARGLAGGDDERQAI